MNYCTSSRPAVVATKPHRCTLCGEGIAIGETHATRTGVNRGQGRWTMRMHPECERFERGTEVVDPDWYEDVAEPAFERREALAWEEAQLGTYLHLDYRAWPTPLAR